MPRRSTLVCIQLCLLVLTSHFLGSQTERVWRRERGTRALKAGQHHRQEGSALVAVMVYHCTAPETHGFLACWNV